MIGRLSREQPSVSGRPPPQPAHIVNFLPGEVEDFLFAPDASGSRGKHSERSDVLHHPSAAA